MFASMGVRRYKHLGDTCAKHVFETTVRAYTISRGGDERVSRIVLSSSVRSVRQSTEIDVVLLGACGVRPVLLLCSGPNRIA